MNENGLSLKQHEPQREIIIYAFGQESITWKNLEIYFFIKKYLKIK